MRKTLGSSLSILLTLGLFFSQTSFALEGGSDQIPDCPDLDGSALPVVNNYVLQWKQTKPNQYRHRARVRGYLTRLFPDHNGHHHFEIQIGANPTDTLEVIYNEDFGPLPTLQKDTKVEACGDFIVSTAPAGGFPRSPDDAIIHWVHTNPSGKGHPPGYLVIDGTLCGQDGENAPARP